MSPSALAPTFVGMQALRCSFSVSPLNNPSPLGGETDLKLHILFDVFVPFSIED